METQVEYIKLEDLRLSKMNPRVDMGDIKGLAEAIKAVGQLQPLTVVRNGSGYEIIAGHRRYTALKSLESETAKCYVFDTMDEVNKFLALMGDNAYHKDFTDAEKSHGVQQMLMLNIDPDMVGKAVGEDGEALRKVRRVLPKLNSEAQKVTIEQAIRIARYEDDPEAIEKINQAGSKVEDVLWGLERAAERAERKAASAIEIEKSGAKLYSLEEFAAIPYGTYTTYTMPGYKNLTKKGCGCDGFSAYIEHYGSVTYFCTKPENHQHIGETPEQAKNREAEQRFDTDWERRTVFFRDFLGHNQPSVAIDYIVTEMLKEQYGENLHDLACEDEEPLQETNNNLLAAGAYDMHSASYSRLAGDGSYYDDDKRRMLDLLSMLEQLGYTLSASEEDIRIHCIAVLESRHPTTQVQNNTEDIESDEDTEEDDIYSID
ncbi:MAG: ParB N-terminal domain-containing protein [Actinobacteria bacterium]|nr:ParB N-terminal domain-containing protein [Actinomycetota bacterium]